jgi:hypothetical protein
MPAARAMTSRLWRFSRDGDVEEPDGPEVEKFCFVFFVLFLQCLPRMYAGALGHSSTSGRTCQGRKARLSGLGSLASWRQGYLVMFAAEGGFSPNLRLNHTSFSLLSETVRPNLLVIHFPAPQCRGTLKPNGCAVRQPSHPLTHLCLLLTSSNHLHCLIT